MVTAEEQCTHNGIRPGYFGTHAVIFVLVLVDFNNHDTSPLVKHKVQPCALRRILAGRCPVDTLAATGERDWQLTVKRQQSPVVSLHKPSRAQCNSECVFLFFECSPKLAVTLEAFGNRRPRVHELGWFELTRPTTPCNDVHVDAELVVLGAMSRFPTWLAVYWVNIATRELAFLVNNIDMFLQPVRRTMRRFLAGLAITWLCAATGE